ncbi:MAG: hypothetical protein FI702_01595 [SAR202 cluster bacterium]|nr:hypothetical protein [SAR202 cluster bacterium]
MPVGVSVTVGVCVGVGVGVGDVVGVGVISHCGVMVNALSPSSLSSTSSVRSTNKPIVCGIEESMASSSRFAIFLIARAPSPSTGKTKTTSPSTVIPTWNSRTIA